MGLVAYVGIHLGCHDEYSEDLNRIPIDGLDCSYGGTEIPRCRDTELISAFTTPSSSLGMTPKK